MTGVGLNAAYYANSYNGAISYTNGVYSTQQDNYGLYESPEAEQQSYHVQQQEQQQQLMAVVFQTMLTMLNGVMQKLMNVAPPAPAPIRPDFNNNGIILARMNQILPPGTDPFLDQMMGVLSNTEPESPEAQQATARIAARWTQLGRDDRQLQELFVLNAIRSLNHISGSLFTISGNLQPQSQESMALNARLGAIANIKNSLIQQWQRLH